MRWLGVGWGEVGGARSGGGRTVLVLAVLGADVLVLDLPAHREVVVVPEQLEARPRPMEPLRPVLRAAARSDPLVSGAAAQGRGRVGAGGDRCGRAGAGGERTWGRASPSSLSRPPRRRPRCLCGSSMPQGPGCRAARGRAARRTPARRRGPPCASPASRAGWGCCLDTSGSALRLCVTAACIDLRSSSIQIVGRDCWPAGSACPTADPPQRRRARVETPRRHLDVAASPVKPCRAPR